MKDQNLIRIESSCILYFEKILIPTKFVNGIKWSTRVNTGRSQGKERSYRGDRVKEAKTDRKRKTRRRETAKRKSEEESENPHAVGSGNGDAREEAQADSLAGITKTLWGRYGITSVKAGPNHENGRKLMI